MAQNRHGCHDERLLEDEKDYFAVLALDDPDGRWPLGPGPVFVSKATGKAWSDAYGNVLEKIGRMQPAGQAVQIQVDIMQGKTWENRSTVVPDSARELWDPIAADIEQAVAKGYTIDIPND